MEANEVTCPINELFHIASTAAQNTALDYEINQTTKGYCMERLVSRVIDHHCFP